ncbi:MAG: LysR family transcriptional regulator, partial [Pseudomonadota bacterium]
MSKRLPPLNALRVFEVAARRLNFTRAAEELHVTNAAVSHQIKLLEDHLGIDLFKRSNNVLRLTDAGELYLPRIREGFKIFQ